MTSKEYDFSFEEIEAIKAAQLRTGTLSVKYIDNDECLYRGRVIRRRDSVPTGYHGRYTVRYHKREADGFSYAKYASFATQKQAKQFIDNLIAGV